MEGQQSWERPSKAIPLQFYLNFDDLGLVVAFDFLISTAGFVPLAFLESLFAVMAVSQRSSLLLQCSESLGAFCVGGTEQSSLPEDR